MLKGHLGIDPHTEIITATAVSAGNAGDASLAGDLISDLLAEHTEGTDTDDTADVETGQGDHVGDAGGGEGAASVYGDNAYGIGPLHDRLERAGIESRWRPSDRSPRAACSPRTVSTSTCSTTR